MSETLEEPLFDPSLKKKKKKKAVAFNEDPLGVEGGASPPAYVRFRRFSKLGVILSLRQTTLSI